MSRCCPKAIRSSCTPAATASSPTSAARTVDQRRALESDSVASWLAWAGAIAGSSPGTSAPSPLPETTVIASEGEIDVASVGAFRTALSEAAGAGAGRLVIDLSEVSFIDSSGLGALLDAHNRLRRDNRRLVVVAPSGTAAAVLLELAGLRGRLPIFETRADALAMR